MTKVVFGMTMSLDGFVNDAEGRMSALYPDMQELGESELMREAVFATGAVIMGRTTFDMAPPDSYAVDYEFQVPIFVVTSRIPNNKPQENDRLSITFVDGAKAAVALAKQAAGDKEVTVVGGTKLGMQLLRAGLVDELQIGIIPVLLGEGLRLFDGLADLDIELRKTRVIETGERTDLFFSVSAARPE
ncbi:dihydrofolate reductase family protein [Saccharibacillus sp. CPCC 101409]|uniref:dihydrofolate reductase family protein n=1 Tax=Saccharibacillus sp. CPCC 101409 TaxID=3058041 RepID=UPI00267354F6|nr:dihydrofolate reductase family protein [Saccharibacillus sp. CPCC 101409]MDO3410571.1 dihydrofolate reductase family protein [Saccharibacillus sp. CPCC 101409]